jgi:hypothetical protein
VAERAGLRVVLFPADGAWTQRKIEMVFPGIGPVFHTPFVSYWRDGVCVASASGKAGRDLIARALSDFGIVADQCVPAAAAANEDAPAAV